MSEKLTPEQETALKAKRREVALKNLKASHLQDLGSAYFVDANGQFGETPNAAIEQFKYFPALSNTNAYDFNSGEEYNILQTSLLGSRAGKKRYSGNISEYDIIQGAGNVLMESLASIKIDDLAEIGLVGNTNLSKKYAGKYISELDKESQQAILGSYQAWLTDNKVSESLVEHGKLVKKNLENILTEPEKKPESD